MLSKKMNDALNEQIKWEYWSGYLYLSMSAYFDDTGLPGFAQWMKYQAAEELFHASKMFDYVCEAGGRIRLDTIEAPKHEWNSALEVMEEGLAHEQEVTRRINELVNIAQEEKDHATASFLMWYVTEQVEEEASFGEIKAKLELVGDGGGLYMIDREVSQRVFTWPAAGEK